MTSVQFPDFGSSSPLPTTPAGLDGPREPIQSSESASAAAQRNWPPLGVENPFTPDLTYSHRILDAIEDMHNQPDVGALLSAVQQSRNATASSERALPFTGWSQSAFYDIAMGVAVRGRTRRRSWRSGHRFSVAVNMWDSWGAVAILEPWSVLRPRDFAWASARSGVRQ
jgi:hypothetical protein